MKKSFTILMALVIIFFTVPLGGITALADEKDYEDIADGEYEITAKALHADKEEESGAAGFIEEDAILSIKDGNVKLTITVPHNDMAKISELQIENVEPTVDGEAWTYALGTLKKALHAQVQYEVPALNIKHDVPFRFMLEGLDDLPVKEEQPKPEAAPEERVVGEQMAESDADAVYELEYETDSASTSGQLLNPVKLFEKDDKQYIQIPVNERGADYFRSLKINGEQVIWNSITEGPYTIQFELVGEIEDTFLLDMVIQAGPNAMAHDGIEINFNTDTMKTIKEPETPEESENPEEPEVPEESEKPEEPKEPEESDDANEGLEVPKDAKEFDFTIMHENGKEASTADTFFKKPGLLFEKDGKQYVQVTVTNGDMIKGLVSKHGEAIIVKEHDDGSMIVQFRVNDDLSNTLLEMRIVVPGMYDTTHKAIIAFDAEVPKEDPKEEIPKEEDLKDDPKPKENPKKEEFSIPDRVEKFDYVVKHATEDETSAADDFFMKPAHVLYKDGEQYLQFTVTSWSMIDWLRTDQGDVTVIKVNDDDSALVQMKIDGDLTDVIYLNMHITVPSMYEMEHEARLFLDVDSAEDADGSDFLIMGDNADPKKPTFGKGDKGGKDEKDNKIEKVTKTDNPKTGDTTSILLYAMLLMGSLIPLAIKLRRRFI